VTKALTEDPSSSSATGSPAPGAPNGAPSPTASTGVVRAATGAGAMTMVALCFANGLQGGGAQTFAQSIDSIKHAFHVSDFAIGVIPACVGIAGNVGAVPIAHFCGRYRRTRVLAVMFVIWGLLFAGAGLVPDFGLAGFAGGGFVLFGILRVASSGLEATDPASLPLIADWWPVHSRARQISIFNAGAGIGAFGGIILGGVIVDDLGWRWAFLAWLPLALWGAALIRRRVEPRRGGMDAAYANELEEATAGAEHDEVVHLIEEPEPTEVAVVAEPGRRWVVVRRLAALRSWRLVAVGLALTGLMGNGVGAWGLTYFKRTFHLSSVKAGALTPALGAGSFLGVLAGGFLADWLIRKGVLRARLIITVLGFGLGGLVYLAAFTTDRLALAAPLLSIASALAAIPTGPQYAAMMDVTPSALRSQAAAAFNVLAACGAAGALLVGGLSSVIGNLRLALLCVSPFYLLGAVLILAAAPTYVADVAKVVADARSGSRSDLAAGGASAGP